VPSHQSVEHFAQALLSVVEPITGKGADAVSMARILTQLFEITALFEMKARPELLLLQKTMAAVEGVGRRIDPTLDMWDAARPIVERYIARELSPLGRAKDYAAEILAALRAIAKLAEREPAPAVVITPPAPSHGALWFILGVLVTAALGLGVRAWIVLG